MMSPIMFFERPRRAGGISPRGYSTPSAPAGAVDTLIAQDIGISSISLNDRRGPAPPSTPRFTALLTYLFVGWLRVLARAAHGHQPSLGATERANRAAQMTRVSPFSLRGRPAAFRP